MALQRGALHDTTKTALKREALKETKRNKIRRTAPSRTSGPPPDPEKIVWGRLSRQKLGAGHILRQKNWS